MDQRREPTRRTFASRRGLEGEVVDGSDVGGVSDTSNMRSMTARTPERLEDAWIEFASAQGLDPTWKQFGVYHVFVAGWNACEATR